MCFYGFFFSTDLYTNPPPLLGSYPPFLPAPLFFFLRRTYFYDILPLPLSRRRSRRSLWTLPTLSWLPSTRATCAVSCTRTSSPTARSCAAPPRGQASPSPCRTLEDARRLATESTEAAGPLPTHTPSSTTAAAGRTAPRRNHRTFLAELLTGGVSGSDLLGQTGMGVVAAATPEQRRGDQVPGREGRRPLRRRRRRKHMRMRTRRRPIMGWSGRRRGLMEGDHMPRRGYARAGR